MPTLSTASCCGAGFPGMSHTPATRKRGPRRDGLVKRIHEYLIYSADSPPLNIQFSGQAGCPH
eukprot:1258164-Lingulodinium_polyedra.AAC.1